MHYDSDNPNFPNVNIAEILKEDSNRFLLAVGSAMRARQIKEGGRPLVDYVPNELMNHVTIALKEISEGKTKIIIKTDSKKQGDVLDEMGKNLDAEISDSDQKEEKETPKKEKVAKKSRSLSA